MILGIGVDMARVSRLERGWARYGERFARRILGPDELGRFSRRPGGDPARTLAKRFAAKEAAAKALGTGFRDGLWLTHIQVDHDPLGRPQLQFCGPAATLAAARGVRQAFVTISDEGDLAVACVVLEGD